MKSKILSKNILMYGIPTTALLSSVYFLWHDHNCVDKFCNLGDELFLLSVCPSAIAFMIIYTGIQKKWSKQKIVAYTIIGLWLGVLIFFLQSMIPYRHY